MFQPKTYELAKRMLSGECGRPLKESMGLVIRDTEYYDSLSMQKKQMYCIQTIAREAPILLIEGEYLAGAATLGAARRGRVPAYSAAKLQIQPEIDRYDFVGTNHVTLGFDRVLHMGLDALRLEVEESLKKHLAAGHAEQAENLEAMIGCLDAADIWHARYLEALQERIAEAKNAAVRARYEEIYRNLEPVPKKAPSNFKEAIQSLWFLFAFQRLCGNWPGIGRIDEMLWPYLEKDLAAGTITEEEAGEYIAHFWIKGAEWCNGEAVEEKDGTGDGQYYQNIILSGVDTQGNDITNPVTYMVLDVVEATHISDFPVSVRIGRNSDPKLIRRVAEVMKLGYGILAVYNEDVVIESLVKLGYPLEEARNFANDGCWEIQIPGKTCFRYTTYDLLRLLQTNVLHMDSDAPSDLPYTEFEELYQAFSVAHRSFLEKEVLGKSWERMKLDVFSLLASLLTDGCVESGIQYWHGGARYISHSPHPGGMPDAANNLLAIRKIVWEDKLMSLNELVDLLKNDWEGEELLRLAMRKKVTYYGNDDDTADDMMVRVYEDYVSAVESFPGIEGIITPAGISTFGRQIEWSNHRYATATGNKKGEFLAHNIDPAPGTDLKGATAVIRSYTKLDMSRLPGGTALTLRLAPSVVKGEKGTDALASLLQSLVLLGGQFLQVDILDVEALKLAREYPDTHGNISVRVSGWSARFNTLNEQHQDMVMKSTEQQM